MHVTLRWFRQQVFSYPCYMNFCLFYNNYIPLNLISCLYRIIIDFFISPFCLFFKVWKTCSLLDAFVFKECNSFLDKHFFTNRILSSKSIKRWIRRNRRERRWECCNRNRELEYSSEYDIVDVIKEREKNTCIYEYLQHFLELAKKELPLEDEIQSAALSLLNVLEPYCAW